MYHSSGRPPSSFVASRAGERICSSAGQRLQSWRLGSAAAISGYSSRDGTVAHRPGRPGRMMKSMMKGMLTAAVAVAIGFLTIVAVWLLLDLHKWPAVMSNEKLIALLLTPIVTGVVAGVLVYRLLDG